MTAFAQKPELVVQSGLAGAAVSVAFSPDGRTLAGSGRETIVVWDRVTGHQIRSISVRGLAPSVVFGPDGQTLASVDMTGVIALWDVATGRNLRSISIPCTLAGCLVAFTRKGALIAAGGDPAKGIKVWDVSSGTMLHHLSTRDIDDFVMTGDGRILAATEHNKNQFVKVWDVSTGKELRTLPLGPYYRTDVPQLAVSPNGRILALKRENRIEVWDILGDKLFDFEAAGERLISFTPLGDALVSKSWNADGTVHLWDASTGHQLKALGEGEGIRTVFFSPDARSVALGREDGVISIRDLESGGQLLALGKHVSGVGVLQFSSNGRILANANYHAINLLSTETGAQLRTLHPKQSEFSSALGLVVARCLAFSPDASILAGGWDNAGIWDVASGRELPAQSSATGILSVAFRPDGRMLAWGSDDQTIRLWEMPGGREIQSLVVNSKVSSVAFSPDGATLASGSWDGVVRLWDTATGRLVKEHAALKESIDSLAFSPDGKTLAAGGGASVPTVFLWDMPGGRQRLTIQRALFIGFSPDSLTFAARDQYATNAATSSVNIWNISNGRKLRTLPRDPGSTFSADWKLAASSFEDAVQLSDAVTGREIATLFALDDNDWVVSDPDGRFDTASLDQINGIGWVFPDEPFHPLNPEIFVRDYYQPKLLARLLRGEKLPEVRQLAALNRAQPEVQFLKVEPEADTAFASITVKVVSTQSATQKDGKGNALESGTYDLRLFRDGQLVGQWPEVPAIAEAASKTDLNSWRDLHGLPLDHGQCTHTFHHIRLPRRAGVDKVQFTSYAFNSDRVKSLTTPPFEYAVPKPSTAPSGFTRRAYVIAMGVNANQSRWNLDFAVASAQDAGRLMREKMAGIYDVVDLSLFSTLAPGSPQVVLQQATKPNLKAVFDLLAGRPVEDAQRNAIDPDRRIHVATPDDAVILFISSHGYADPHGSFYVVPYDTGPYFGVTEDSLIRCQTHSDDRSPACQMANAFLGHTISSQDLTAWWAGVDASEMIMILDSCHSAAVAGREFRPGPLGDAGFGQLSYDKGMRILSATQPDKTARATMVQGVGHSLLVEALLEEAKTHPQENVSDWLSDTGRQIAGVTHRLYPELREADLQVPELFDFNVNDRHRVAAVVAGELRQPR